MQFVITNSLRGAITVASQLKGLSGQDSALVLALTQADSITIAQVSSLSSILRSHAASGYNGPKWVHELLESSEIYVPPPPAPKEKDPKLVARLQKMQMEIDNRKYMKMVKDVSTYKQREEYLDRVELKSAKAQASIGYNIVFTTLTAFAIGYFIGMLNSDNVMGLILGAILSILALVGETLLFVISGTRRDKDMYQRMVQEEKGRLNPFEESGLGSKGVVETQLAPMELTSSEAAPTK